MTVEQQAERGTMTTTVPIPKITRFLTHPEASAIRRQPAKRICDPALADAEEEEMAQLWADDPGNQGA
jgi:hypothetical protein